MAGRSSSTCGRIKSTMQMDVLRCKTPELVRKEMWAHVLAYNLLRTVMAVGRGRERHRAPPRSASRGPSRRCGVRPEAGGGPAGGPGALVDALLAAVACHRVGDRPGRWEPRARKRRAKHATRLTQPRAAARLPENRPKWA